MQPRNDPDRIYVPFDDHRLVATAGLVLTVTSAHHLELGKLVDHHIDLGDAPGQCSFSRQLLVRFVDPPSALVKCAEIHSLPCVISLTRLEHPHLRRHSHAEITKVLRSSDELTYGLLLRR